MSGTGFGAIVSRVAGAGVLLGLAFGGVPGVDPDRAFGAAADKATDCLNGPRGTAPSGERWHYRVERGTKRHCWYTRAETSRKSVAQIPAPREPAKFAEKIPEKTPDEPAPLQSSVANARAEADLSDLPRPGLGMVLRGDSALGTAPEPPAPTWTLADRWSNHVDANAPVPSLPMRVAPPASAETNEPNADDEMSDDSLRAVAAGTVALLGLSTVLIAVLMRRRKQDQPDGGWHFAQRCSDATGSGPSLTDLNDEALMTWRKKPKDDLRAAWQTAGQRDAAIRRIKRLT